MNKTYKINSFFFFFLHYFSHLGKAAVDGLKEEEGLRKRRFNPKYESSPSLNSRIYSPFLNLFSEVPFFCVFVLIFCLFLIYNSLKSWKHILFNQNELLPSWAFGSLVQAHLETGLNQGSAHLCEFKTSFRFSSLTTLVTTLWRVTSSKANFAAAFCNTRKIIKRQKLHVNIPKTRVFFRTSC